MDKEDVLKICDFGTSHQWNKKKSTVMSFCGTVSWMAPEIIKKEPCCDKVSRSPNELRHPLCVQVDVWSFGVVLWELLTQEVPYKDIDSMAVLWGVGSKYGNFLAGCTS